MEQKIERRNNANMYSEGLVITRRRCCSKHSLGTASHASYAPVYQKNSICYMSGSRQITEIQFHSTLGFRVVRWEKSHDGVVKAFWSCNFEKQSGGVWGVLEQDMVNGNARLYDRSSVRGVGQSPQKRKQSRATDDVSVVVNWIRHNEARLEMLLIKQKQDLQKANAALLDGVEDMPIELPMGRDSMEKASRTAKAVAYCDWVPIKPLISQGWDYDGSLALRGRFVRNSKGEAAKNLSKKERIARLMNMSKRQKDIAMARLEAGDIARCNYFAELSKISEEKANKLQLELDK